MLRHVALAAGIVVLMAGCAAPKPAPQASTTASRPSVRTPVSGDWFHQQLEAARAARRAHQPRSDTTGAQKAYDDILRAACTRLALGDPGKYQSRCDAVLQPAHPDPFECADNSSDTATLTTCND